MEFPDREDIKKNIKMDNYQSSLLDKLKEAVNNSDPRQWKDEPDIKKVEVEKQKEYFWTRIYLKDDDKDLEQGDILTMTYVPTNEKIEMIFGSYEKEGLNRDHNGEVINYISKDNRSILCCMIDIERINKNSDDIPTLKTFFKSSRYYKENLFLKDEIVIESKDKKYEYTSLSF